ncbi:hypothetical protein Clacol_010473 [Clathrus columnatus]|uniref:Uncharacterized protein n=1 Tax=Clathrus columnatus TaxID=1419009 RepID=A0AAV5AT62_9AGAM|nr:hypothetical protein Clacol_010473 [Clathrus columnatus]
MFSRDDPTILHPAKHPGLAYKFISPDAEKTDMGTKTEDPSKNKLVELVISSSSLDCPHPSLCDPDGHFHSKDLFEEVEPNGFVYRGRLDDIIMMDKVGVVVGSGKPSPVLLVEPLEEAVDTSSLKEIIGKKVGLINKDGPSYERIRPSDILIVLPGTLPRTPKGNINRNAAERLFRQDIDAFFDV